MQLIPRYLLKNRITILASDAGFFTEYVPVYTRQIKIYRGIDNTIQFKLLNADQRPIDINLYTPQFVAFDENHKMVISHTGSVNQIDDSSASRGLFTITITENDLLNIKRQYLRYNIYLLDSDNNKVLTYVDSHFDNNGTIFVDDYAFPGPIDSTSITSFTEDGDNWYSESTSANPGINGNEALHTVAVYTTNFVGSLILQATLDNNSSTTEWADIHTFNFTGAESEPIPLNFNGVFSWIRFKTANNPLDKINQILIRN